MTEKTRQDKEYEKIGDLNCMYQKCREIKYFCAGIFISAGWMANVEQPVTNGGTFLTCLLMVGSFLIGIHNHLKSKRMLDEIHFKEEVIKIIQ